MSNINDERVYSQEIIESLNRQERDSEEYNRQVCKESYEWLEDPNMSEAGKNLALLFLQANGEIDCF